MKIIVQRRDRVGPVEYSLEGPVEQEWDEDAYVFVGRDGSVILRRSEVATIQLQPTTMERQARFEEALKARMDRLEAEVKEQRQTWSVEYTSEAIAPLKYLKLTGDDEGHDEGRPPRRWLQRLLRKG